MGYSQTKGQIRQCWGRVHYQHPQRSFFFLISCPACGGCFEDWKRGTEGRGSAPPSPQAKKIKGVIVNSCLGQPVGNPQTTAKRAAVPLAGFQLSAAGVQAPVWSTGASTGAPLTSVHCHCDLCTFVWAALMMQTMTNPWIAATCRPCFISLATPGHPHVGESAGGPALFLGQWCGDPVIGPWPLTQTKQCPVWNASASQFHLSLILASFLGYSTSKTFPYLVVQTAISPEMVNATSVCWFSEATSRPQFGPCLDRLSTGWGRRAQGVREGRMKVDQSWKGVGSGSAPLAGS